MSKEMYAIMAMLSNARELHGLADDHHLKVVAFPPLAAVVRVDKEVRDRTKTTTVKNTSDAKALVVKVTPVGYENWNTEAYFWFAIAFLQKVVNDGWKPHREIGSMHELLETAYNVEIPLAVREKYRDMAAKAVGRANMLGYFRG